MNSPWEYIWVGLVLTVVGAGLLGLALALLDPAAPLGLLMTLGGIGLAVFGGIVSGIGVIAEGVRLGGYFTQQQAPQQWAPPRVRQD